jgi:hypothetical protein
MLDIGKIKERAEKATTSEPYRDGSIWRMRMAGRHIWEIVTKDLLHIAYVTLDANADFVQHSRNDIPALVAEVERLRAALDAILNIVSPENDPDDHSLTVEGVVDNVLAMRNLLHSTMKERDAERKACDGFYSAGTKTHNSIFGTTEKIDAETYWRAWDHHRARRAAEKGTT